MPPTSFDNAFTNGGRYTAAVAESDTSNATSTCEITIHENYRNGPKVTTVHGGAIATFFDNVTSLTMLGGRNAESWNGATGVTRSLHVTYFLPAHVGDMIIIESEVLQMTRRLATIKGVMKRASDRKLLAMCVHEKYNPSAKKVVSKL